MAKRTETLSEKIVAFMARHNMSKTVLGQKALNSPHAIFDLFEGKHRMWPETRAKLEDFMAAYDREAA